jgi:hypothetical protein
MGDGVSSFDVDGGPVGRVPVEVCLLRMEVNMGPGHGCILSAGFILDVGL